MATQELPQNSLLSNSKSSDSRLQVQLHPLVILTISDYITRHFLRKQSGPIVGAILGSQNGREITMEHAFECKVESGESESHVLVDVDWFQDRLQQYKDVHKAPALDFVGWFTLAPPEGPQAVHLPIHQQLLNGFNESALLLTFHPSAVASREAKGGKLPLNIYETVYEAASVDSDKQMASSGEAGPQLTLKFQQLPYSIETNDAEMIAVDFVARGYGDARAVDSSVEPDTASASTNSNNRDKGKAPANKHTSTDATNSAISSNAQVLSSEDEELIASLTAKSNAIQMLQERIRLIKQYLNSLPQCYLNTPPSASSAPVEIAPNDQISYPILRQANSMLARLPLLTPVSASAKSDSLNGASTDSSLLQGQNNLTPLSPHTLDRRTQQTDSQLVSLLSRLGSTLQSASSLGGKFQVFEASRNISAHGQRRGGSQMPLAFDQTGFSDGVYTANPSFGSVGASQFGKSNGSARGNVSLPPMPMSSSSNAPFDAIGDDAYGESSVMDHPEDAEMQQEDWEAMDENL